MDAPLLNLVFDSLNILGSLALVLCLSLVGRRDQKFLDPNWNLVILGFSLLTLSFTVDFLEPFLIETYFAYWQAALETIFAFTGLSLAAFGLGRWFSLKEYAFNDRLTGLKNRLELERYATNLLKQRQMNTQLALLFLDIDGFKKVNDNYGHAYGDSLLKYLAQRLLSQTRQEDQVFRLGGDEFIVLLNLTKEDDVQAIAQRYLDSFQKPFEVHGKLLSLSTSIGISLSPEHGISLEELLEKADKAMYQAKRKGKNQVNVYKEQVKQTLLTQELHSLLFDALEKQEFYLEYQPVLQADGSLHSLEALIRWRKANGDSVSPVEFIPLAESSGFIVPLGEWILDTVCATLQRLKERGYPNLKIAVNVSSAQLAQPAFKYQFEQALSKHQISPQYLEIEVTEGVVIAPQAIEQLMYLKRIGVTVAMDDFGTGYSSLGNLHSLPFDIIKIDKVFVDQLSQAKPQTSLAGTIIKLSHQLGKKTIAEGVETLEQLNALRQLGCDYFQGYYFSRPIAGEQLHELLDMHYPLAILERNKQEKALFLN